MISIEESKFTTVALLDISKAFDCIYHNIIIIIQVDTGVLSCLVCKLLITKNKYAAIIMQDLFSMLAEMVCQRDLQ